jgi:MioC protein
MPLDISILVGTMTGTAELCAEEMCISLEALGHRAKMTLMDDLEADVFDPATAYIICVSTYGHGDVPDNAKKLYESLQSQKPALSGLHYGVFSLGDITHGETFCWGGINFNKVLTELQATRVGEIVKNDATSGELPEDQAGEWAVTWVKLLEAINSHQSRSI